MGNNVNLEHMNRATFLFKLDKFPNLNMSYFLGNERKEIISKNTDTFTLKFLVFSKRFNLEIHDSIHGHKFITDTSGKLTLYDNLLLWVPNGNNDV